MIGVVEAAEDAKIIVGESFAEEAIEWYGVGDGGGRSMIQDMCDGAECLSPTGKACAHEGGGCT